MKAGAFLKAALQTTKGKVVAIGGSTAIAVSIGAAVLLQGEGFRSISVEQVTGTVNIVGEQNNGQAYVGEHLYSGDDVTVGDASELTMCMDNDKYVYADANTHFTLEASADKDDSLIKIYLDAGSELNELQSKLDPNDTYEVDTPNSTMSVRGTKFRVTVYKAKDGLVYALSEVNDGEVLVKLKTTDGTYNGVEKLFTPGQSALIRGNSDFSEFVTSAMLDNADLSNLTEEDTVLMLAYDSLPEDGLERLIALLENGGIIDETDETEDEIKTQAALRPTPKPVLTPTPSPSPTPSPTPTGPSQEELLRQLLALMQTTPSPTPTYTPSPDDDEEESEDSGDYSEPEPTTYVDTETSAGYTYYPDTGVVEYGGTQIGQITNNKLVFNGAAGTPVLPIKIYGTNYSIANGNIDIENSDDGITYSESNLSTAAMIAAVKSSTHQANIQTSRGGLVNRINNGVITYDGSANDVETFNELHSAGDGEYTLFTKGGTEWVKSTVASGAVTQYNDYNNQTYSVTGNAPVYDATNSRITGTVEDPNNLGQILNFSLDEANGFVTTP